MKGRRRGWQGMAWQVFALFVVGTQIVACGSVLDALPGAGGTATKSSNLGPDPSSGVLSGVAKDALLRNAAVKVYAWNGAKGELLGSGTTDSRGKYSFSLQTRSQPILLEVSGGDYLEEVTLKTISLSDGEALYAVRNYISGQALNTSVTYYTTLATGLAEHLVRLGMKSPDAVEEANTRLATIIGVDASTVRPTDILNPDSVSVPELEYGFATAALSSLTERASILNSSEPHSVFTSVRFIQAAYDDVRADGVLNGRGSNGNVVFGRIRLTTQVYRHELALHILRIANNTDANRTGRGPMQMLDLARRLNDSTDPIFGGDPVIPIDSDKPSVSALAAKEFPTLLNGATVFGGLNLSAVVMAFPGAASAELVLDGRIVGRAVNPEDPAVLLDTLNPAIQEGRHSLQFRVTDISGAVGDSPSLDVIISNQQTAIENVSIAGQLLGKEDLVPLITADIVDPALPRVIRYSVKSRDASAFTSVATINFDTEATTVQSAARVDLGRAMLSDADATFRVEATNSVGVTSSKEVLFTVDLVDPVLSIPTAIVLDSRNPDNLQGQYFDQQAGIPCMPLQPVDPDDSCVLYVRRSFDITTQVSDNRALDSVTLTVDGKTVGQPLMATDVLTTATPTFTVDPVTFLPPGRGDREGPKNLTITAVDKARNVSVDSRQIVFDTTPPILVSPLEMRPATGANSGFRLDGDPVTVKGAFDISAQVQDNLGFSSAALLLDGVPIAEGRANQGTNVLLAANGFDTSSTSDGLHVLSVVAVDRAASSIASDMTSGHLLSFRVDNTPPVITLTGLVFGAERCSLEGSVSDERFDSLVFTTDQGFQSTITSGGTGDSFLIRLGNAVNYMLDARDTLGNLNTRNLKLEVTRRSFNFMGTSVSILDTCELQENGVVLFRARRVE